MRLTSTVAPRQPASRSLRLAPLDLGSRRYPRYSVISSGASLASGVEKSPLRLHRLLISSGVEKSLSRLHKRQPLIAWLVFPS